MRVKTIRKYKTLQDPDFVNSHAIINVESETETTYTGSYTHLFGMDIITIPKDICVVIPDEDFTIEDFHEKITEYFGSKQFTRLNISDLFEGELDGVNYYMSKAELLPIVIKMVDKGFLNELIKPEQIPQYTIKKYSSQYLKKIHSNINGI